MLVPMQPDMQSSAQQRRAQHAHACALLLSAPLAGQQCTSCALTGNAMQGTTALHLGASAEGAGATLHLAGEPRHNCNSHNTERCGSNTSNTSSPPAGSAGQHTHPMRGAMC